MKTKKSVVILTVILICSSLFCLGANGKKDAVTVKKTGSVEFVGYSLPLAEQKTISIMTSDSYDGETLPKTAIWQEIEKKTNIKVKWDLIESSNFNEIANTRLAAGVGLADIVKLPGADIDMKYQKSGLFLPLNDLITMYGVELQRKFIERQDMKAQWSNPNGEIYFVSDRYMPSTVQRHILFNQNWLSAVGKKMPTTTNEFYDVLVAFRDGDPNGNGESDEIPFSPQDIPCLHNSLAPSFGLDVDSGFLIIDDKTVECSLVSPKLKNYLVFLNKLYEEDLLDKEFPGKSYDLLAGNVASDTVGSAACWSWFQMTFSETAGGEGYNYKKSTDGVWKGQMPLIGPDKDQFMVKRGEFTGSPFGISAKSKDPDTAFIFMDYAYSDEKIILNNWGVDGIHTEVINGVRRFTEAAQKDADLIRLTGRGQGPMLWQDEETTYARLAKWHIDVDKALQEYFIPGFPLVYAYETELDTINKFNADMQTYSREMILRFIVGEEPMENFDKYLETLKKMGIDDVTAVKQAQYDRYLSNL